MTRIIINGSFLYQQKTGQQRFASEISNCLLSLSTNETQFHLQRPPAWAAKRALLAWIWVQWTALLLRKDELFLSLTSKVPLIRMRRSVVTVHDLFPLERPDWYSKKYIRVHQFALQRVLKGSTKLLVTVSNSVATKVLSRSRCASIVVAPNCISSVFLTRPHQKEIGATLDKFGLARDKFVLLSNPSDPRKNINYFVQAWTKLPADLTEKYTLVATGAANRRVFRSDSTADAVRSLGFVTDLELSHLYASCSLFCFPSLDEGFGIPPLEATAMGAKVLISDIPVHRELQLPEQTYVQLNDESKFAHQIYGALGLEKNSGVSPMHFGTWEDSAEKLANGIRSLVSDAH